MTEKRGMNYVKCYLSNTNTASLPAMLKLFTVAKLGKVNPHDSLENS